MFETLIMYNTDGFGARHRSAIAANTFFFTGALIHAKGILRFGLFIQTRCFEDLNCEG